MEFTMEFTKEMLEKAKKAESAEALQALAKENGCEISEDEAEAYFAQMHKSGELSDEELENVSGGGCRKNGHLVVTILYSCNMWKCKKDMGSKYYNGLQTTDTNRPGVECSNCGTYPNCRSCYYCHYEKGLWLCYNPSK